MLDIIKIILMLALGLICLVFGMPWQLVLALALGTIVIRTFLTWRSRAAYIHEALKPGAGLEVKSPMSGPWPLRIAVAITIAGWVAIIATGAIH